MQTLNLTLPVQVRVLLVWHRILNTSHLVHAIIVTVVSRFDAEVKIFGTCGHCLSSLTAAEVKSFLIIVSVVTVHLIAINCKA